MQRTTKEGCKLDFPGGIHCMLGAHLSLFHALQHLTNLVNAKLGLPCADESPRKKTPESPFYTLRYHEQERLSHRLLSTREG